MNDDFSRTDVLAIAKLLLGEPNKNLSHGEAVRFGPHGNVTIQLGTGRFYDDAAALGGDLVELVQRTKGLPRAGAIAWLRAHGVRS
jgi:hypothetical protein